MHAQWSCVDDEKKAHLLFILPVVISVRKGRNVWRKPIPSLPPSATEKIGEFYFDVGIGCWPIVVERTTDYFPTTTIPICSSNSDQGRTKYIYLLADKDELVVMIPTILLKIHSRLELFRIAASCAGTAATGQLKTLLLKHVESLLDGTVLQEESRGVTIRSAVVRITAFVQSFPEHVPTKGHATAYKDPRQLPKLYIRQALATECKASAITDSYVSGRSLPGRGQGTGRLAVLQNGTFQSRQAVKICFLPQSLLLSKPLRQNQCLIAQKIKHVTEQYPVSIQKIFPLRIFLYRRFPRKQCGQMRIALPGKGGQSGGVKHTAHVQLHHAWHGFLLLLRLLLIHHASRRFSDRLVSRTTPRVATRATDNRATIVGTTKFGEGWCVRAGWTMTSGKKGKRNGIFRHRNIFYLCLPVQR